MPSTLRFPTSGSCIGRWHEAKCVRRIGRIHLGAESMDRERHPVSWTGATIGICYRSAISRRLSWERKLSGRSDCLGTHASSDLSRQVAYLSDQQFLENFSRRDLVWTLLPIKQGSLCWQAHGMQDGRREILWRDRIRGGVGCMGIA